jgi:hypothetical protein
MEIEEYGVCLQSTSFSGFSQSCHSFLRTRFYIWERTYNFWLSHSGFFPLTWWSLVLYDIISFFSTVYIIYHIFFIYSLVDRQLGWFHILVILWTVLLWTWVCLFILVIALMCRNFLIWCNSICQFLLLFPEQLEYCSENHCLFLYRHAFSLLFPVAVSNVQVLL